MTDINTQALEAAQQCIEDFIGVYKRDCSKLVFDEAVKSLRDDALPKIRQALHTKPAPDAAALARMLRDEQAAHEATQKRFADVRTDRDAWQNLATQRQQETEAAQRWARRWKASATETRRANAFNRLLAAQNNAVADRRLEATTDQARRAALALEAAQQRLNQIRELAENFECWLPPMYRAELAALLKEEGASHKAPQYNGQTMLAAILAELDAAALQYDEVDEAFNAMAVRDVTDHIRARFETEANNAGL